MAWETKPYLDEKLYDAILIMRDKSPLDSLALIIQQTTNKKQIERDHTDSFIVIVACSIGGKDTLSLSNNPGYVEINNRWYPDSSLFWWAVNTIAEKDESWMLNNNSFLNVISMPNDD